MNRRELLYSLGGLWALQACRPLDLLTQAPSEGPWFYSGVSLPGKTYGIGATWSSEGRVYPVKNVIHSVVYDDESKLKVFLPKSGAEAYYQTGENPLKTFHPAEGNYFYGHGAFDLKRNVFYTTQSAVTADGPNEERMYNKGFIYVHSMDDFRIINKFSTSGNDPHDLRIVGDEIVVCNGGHLSNVSFINPDSGKVSQSFPLNDEMLSAGHIEMLDSENFVIVTGSYRQHYPPAIYSLNRETGLKKFPIPEGLDPLFRVQLLSVVNYRNLILATCPQTDSLFVWDKDGKFFGAHQIKKAASLAVTHELGGVIVGSDLDSEPLRLISFDAGQMKVKALDWGPRNTGSHALVIPG
ncbi:MAG: DUF1513 domain-containing protein [Bdellovibrionota bacterium]